MGLLEVHLRNGEIDMNHKMMIENYLISEKKIFGATLLKAMAKVTKYEDIETEFCLWLEQRNYDFGQPISINGHTAKEIYELAPDLDGIGVYNYLVFLRDNPRIAEEYIKEGLKIQ